MSWSVVLPGQPPTLNKLYEPKWRTATDGRRYMGVGKNHTAQRYHDDMAMIIRNAKPSGWAPADGSFVRLQIRLYLAHDIDADNVLKVLSDAIQSGTGIDDRWFLPSIACKHIVERDNLARVEVFVSEEPPHSQCFTMVGPEVTI